MKTEADEFLGFLRKENAAMTYMLKLIKELEDCQQMCNELGDQKEALRKENDELKSRLRLGRAKYADLQKENTRLKRDIDEYLDN